MFWSAARLEFPILCVSPLHCGLTGSFLICVHLRHLRIFVPGGCLDGTVWGHSCFRLQSCRNSYTVCVPVALCCGLTGSFLICVHLRHLRILVPGDCLGGKTVRGHSCFSPQSCRNSNTVCVPVALCHLRILVPGACLEFPILCVSPSQ